MEEVEAAPGATCLESKCPICLEEYDNKSFVDVCFHAFCYVCILQWSDVSNKCPMCKMTYRSLIYDVKSNSDYKKHAIKAPTRRSSATQDISINEARRFRYRTTVLPGERQPQEGQRHRLKQSRKPASEERRKTVYQSGMRALAFTMVDKKIRIRNISATFFKANPAATHRLLPWLARDIKVLLGEEHVEFIIQMILSLIDKVDLESPDFMEHLKPFFHDKTEHFFHELISFAKSPLDMTAYDHKVSYGLPQRSTAALPKEETKQERHDISEPGPSSEAVQSSSNVIDITQSPPARGGTGEEEEIRERLFHELATSSWDPSPLMIRNLSPTEEEEDVIYVNSSSEPETERVQTVTKRELQVNEISCSTSQSDPPIGGVSAKGSGSSTYPNYASKSGRESKSGKASRKVSSNEEDISSVSSRSSSVSSRTHSKRHHRSQKRVDTKSRSEKKRERRESSTDHSPVSYKRHSSSDEYYRSSSHRERKGSSDYKHTRSKESKRSSRDIYRDDSDRKRKKKSHKIRDRSHDRERKSHDERRRSHDSRSHDRDRSHDHDRKSSSKRETSRRTKKRSHDSDKRHHFDRDGQSSRRQTLDSISSEEISTELQSVNEDLITMRRQLLKNLLQKERTDLLKHALQKELTGESLTPPTATPTQVQEEDCQSNTSSVDELVKELQEVERAIEKGKREVLTVAKRLESYDGASSSAEEIN